MLTIPISDLLLLPGVTFYFKKDTFPGHIITADQVGEEVLFVMLRSGADREKLTAESIYPVGIYGKIDSLDEDDNFRVQAMGRVRITDIHQEEDALQVHHQ